MGSPSPASVKNVSLSLNYGNMNAADLRLVSTDLFRTIHDFGDISGDIPAGSTITLAEFSWVCNSIESAGVGRAFSCHPLTEFAWAAAECTWTDQTSDPLAWATAGGSFEATSGRSSGLTSPLSTGTKTLDITDTIQWILDTNPTTCQFMFKLDNEGIAADSRYNRAGTSLSITFTTPSGAIYQHHYLFDD